MISLHNLGLAYRKAKVDLYYSSHASLEAIADYEEHLHANLSALLVKMESDDESWVTQPDIVGGWTLAPKSVDMSCWEKYRAESGNGLIFSSPAEEWTYACARLAEDTKAQKTPAEFRVMADCSLDFHVLSTLWMLEVGHLFDAKLTSCAYGNRLRRTQDAKSINPLSLGSFKPYLKPFRDWRDKGIAAMRSALEADKKIVALTADISSFYHELNPSFMLTDAFVVEGLELELSASQAKLHRLFIHALQAWAQATPLKKGLPVGLPASAVVANVALVDLDRCIEQQIVPIYYGRYVDDILLVMENGVGFRSTEELWDWLFARSGGKLGWVKGEEHKQIGFHPTYLHDSKIRFANAKNKVFLLGGETGKTLVDAIDHQIRESASEWRAMPRLPRSASYVGTDFLAATQSDGEAADNLRKADALSMRRAGFAIKLRDFEAYERDLAPDTWQAHRQAFFRAFVQHVLVLPQFFDLAQYLPRVIRLATACEDFADLRKILEALKQLSTQLNEQCTLGIKACPAESVPCTSELMQVWKTQLDTTVRESISAAFPPKLTKEGKAAWQAHMADYATADFDACRGWPLSTKEFQVRQARLFSFDLAHQPFRFVGLPQQMVAQRGIPARKTIVPCAHATELLPSTVLDGSRQLAQWMCCKGLPHGLLFATRPYNLPELFILNKAAYDLGQREAMNAVVLAVRGFKPGEATPGFDTHGVLQIQDGHTERRFGVAVASWETQMASWAASVMRMPDPDAERYARLCRLLDGVIAQPQRSRYLILPELALPAHWFIRIARKLHQRGISLISGIEYLHASKARVRNQVWAALSHNGMGFPTQMIYRQDKQ